MIKWDLQAGQAGWALGSVEGIAVEMETGNYVADMTKEVALYAEKEMQRQIDLLANTGADLEHVYEFKKSGTFTPADRLFNIFQTGQGSRRAITYTFLPSKRGGPSIKDRISMGKLRVDASDRVFKPGKRSGNKVDINKRYIFRNKAAMLEFGGEASVVPKNKKIFVPFRQGEGGERPYAFLRETHIDLTGTRHMGKFSAAWKIAGATVGTKAEEFVRTKFVGDIKRVRMRQGGISKKSFGVAFVEGKNAAEAML